MLNRKYFIFVLLFSICVHLNNTDLSISHFAIKSDRKSLQFQNKVLLDFSCSFPCYRKTGYIISCQKSQLLILISPETVNKYGHHHPDYLQRLVPQ